MENLDYFFNSGPRRMDIVTTASRCRLSPGEFKSLAWEHGWDIDEVDHYMSKVWLLASPNFAEFVSRGQKGSRKPFELIIVNY